MSDESAGLEKVMGWLETLTQSQSNVIHCIVCMRWVYTEYNSIKEKKKTVTFDSKVSSQLNRVIELKNFRTINGLYNEENQLKN